MASRKLFKKAPTAPVADALNEAGGAAYKLDAKAAIAQMVATATFHDSFYKKAEEQLQELLKLSAEVDPGFLAKTAIYGRQSGKMKDAPALLLAVLSKRAPELFTKVFDRVVDNAKMLRNFVQIVRSGVAGRKCLGSSPKRMIQRYFSRLTDEQLFRSSVGSDPSIGDVLKLAHPKPPSASRGALYGYLAGKAPADTDDRLKGTYRPSDLPPLVKEYEAFKAGKPGERVVPPVPWEMLTALDLSEDEWVTLALRATWTQTRMNLNTFARHGVFKHEGATAAVAAKLRSREEIARTKLFPYQLLVAYLNTKDVPVEVRNALQDAMEIATENVPAIEGRVRVIVDVSGSMGHSITGYVKGATSAVRSVDVAALIASCILRKNNSAKVTAVDTKLYAPDLNPRDSVVTNAGKLAAHGGGGTNLSLPFDALVEKREPVDFVLVVSDLESWVDSRRQMPYYFNWPHHASATSMMEKWDAIRKFSPTAKLFCLNLQGGTTTQAQERKDILNYGGWSDAVFDVIADFSSGRTGAEHWVRLIEEVAI